MLCLLWYPNGIISFELLNSNYIVNVDLGAIKYVGRLSTIVNRRNVVLFNDNEI